MTITTTTNFEFRNKFKKFLNEENLPVITGAFQKFSILNPEAALNLLWRMTYSNETAFQVCKEFEISEEIISSLNISSLRNEFRFQYEKLHPDFLNVDMPLECKEHFAELVNKTDQIVAKIVFKHCISLLSVGEHYMNRLLFLLNNDNENNYFGGIRSLCFTVEEAEYLKPFHHLIYNLLKVVNKHINSSYNSFESQFDEGDECIDDLPFYNMDEEDAENEEEMFEEECFEFKSITPEEILLHKEVFDEFVTTGDMNMLLSIGTLGFDLNEVFMKREDIHNFINAAKALY